MTPEGFIWDLDRGLLLTLNGSWGAGWDTFWWSVSQMWFWAPMYVAMAGLLWWKFGWRKMLVAVALVVAGIVLADQMANLFKVHTPKFRPSHTSMPWEGVPYNSLVHTVRGYLGGSFGTVSGHAATSMAIALTAAGIYRRWWFSSVAALYVILVCYSRMYLGVHFPLDILFGVCGGTIIGSLMLWAWRAIIRRWGGFLQRTGGKVES
jgi:undecaprenyl-diphosphatase